MSALGKAIQAALADKLFCGDTQTEKELNALEAIRTKQSSRHKECNEMAKKLKALATEMTLAQGELSGLLKELVKAANRTTPPVNPPFKKTLMDIVAAGLAYEVKLKERLKKTKQAEQELTKLADAAKKSATV